MKISTKNKKKMRCYEKKKKKKKEEWTACYMTHLPLTMASNSIYPSYLHFLTIKSKTGMKLKSQGTTERKSLLIHTFYSILNSLLANSYLLKLGHQYHKLSKSHLKCNSRLIKPIQQNYCTHSKSK